MKSTSVVLPLLLVGAVAHAEPGDPTFDPMSMDRHTPLTTLAFDLGYEVYDEPANTDINVMSLNIGGQFVSRSGAGAYFTLPLTYLDYDTPAFDDSEMAIGNIEVGGLFTKFFSRAALVVHAGVALPTAQDEDLASVQVVGSFTRLSDLPQRVIQSTWLRLGISPMGRSGSLLWRADAGLDLALDEDSSDISPIFHVNVGGGVDLGSVQILGELVNVFTDDEAGDDDASTVSVGARFTSGNLRPGLALLFPIDLDAAPDFEWALLGSLAVRLPSI